MVAPLLSATTLPMFTLDLKTDDDVHAFPMYEPLPKTGVVYNTSDSSLQALYDHGATQEAGNGKPFLLTPEFLCLEEGEQYKGAWLETQPMAGAMYASRSVRLALNNQLVFIRSQRADGRYSHRVDPCSGGNHKTDPVCTTLHPGWSTYLQGLFMASPVSTRATPSLPTPVNMYTQFRSRIRCNLWLLLCTHIHQ